MAQFLGMLLPTLKTLKNSIIAIFGGQLKPSTAFESIKYFY